MRESLAYTLTSSSSGASIVINNTIAAPPTGWYSEPDGVIFQAGLASAVMSRPQAHGSWIDASWREGITGVFNIVNIGSTLALRQSQQDAMLSILDAMMGDDGGSGTVSWTSQDSGSSAASAYKTSVNARVPVGYWRLEETTGSTATSETGSNNGTYGAGITLAQTGILTGSYSALFPATAGGVITVPYAAGINPVVWSFETWVNTASLGTTQYLYRSWSGTNNGFAVYLSNGLPTVSVTSNGGGAFTVSSVTPVVSGAWTHVVATYDGTNIRLYVNGVLDPATPYAGTYAQNTTAAATIGGDAGANGLSGYMDEPVLYDSVLSATNISSHYASGTVSYARQVSGLTLVQPPQWSTVAGGIKRLQFILQSEKPYAESATAVVYDTSSFAAAGGGFTIPLTIPITFTAGGAGTTGVTNTGTCDYYPILQIYGPITAPVITRSSTYAATTSLAFTGSIASGDYWEINTLDRTVQKNGATDSTSSQLASLDLSRSTWFGLVPGYNAIQMTGSGYDTTHTRCRVQMRNAWI